LLFAITPTMSPVPTSATPDPVTSLPTGRPELGNRDRLALGGFDLDGGLVAEAARRSDDDVALARIDPDIARGRDRIRLVIDHELGALRELGERDREVRHERLELDDVLVGGLPVLVHAVLAREVTRLQEHLERGGDLVRLFVAQADVQDRPDGAAVVAKRLVVLGAGLRVLAGLLQLLRLVEDPVGLRGVLLFTIASLRACEAMGGQHDRQHHHRSHSTIVTQPSGAITYCSCASS
jgi:hypothetical protein